MTVAAPAMTMTMTKARPMTADDVADADSADDDDRARVSAMKVAGGFLRARAADGREWPALHYLTRIAPPTPQRVILRRARFC
eukprot:8617819-Pyramimonas_sp.AAC.1